MSSAKFCIYCGAWDELTADHVPPRCIFGDPKPQNLVTVPACRTCNQSRNHDDEYLRTFLVTGAFASAQTAQDLWNRKIIGSPNAAPVRRELIRSLIRVEQKSPAGLYLGKVMAAKFDVQRINRTVGSIARGLLWHHYKIIPCSRIGVRVGWLRDFDKFSEIIAATNYTEIERSIFHYRHGVAIEDPTQSSWFFEFYSSMRCIVLLTREEFESEWLVRV